MKLTPTLTRRDDLLWLAGVLEAAGTLDSHRGRYPRIRFGSTDRDVTGRVATLLGAKVRVALKPAPYAAVWHTEQSGENAATAMRALLPLLGARRSAEVAKILGAYELGGTKPKRRPAPEIHRPAATPLPELVP